MRYREERSHGELVYEKPFHGEPSVRTLHRHAE